MQASPSMETEMLVTPARRLMRLPQAAAGGHGGRHPSLCNLGSNLSQSSLR